MGKGRDPELTALVTVRCRPELKWGAKVLAERDGLTLSEYIRGLVAVEVERAILRDRRQQRT
ncbi:MAG TPA: hypothetical protein VMN39_01020 [Longimicrobiaceae bacterium]|nr:hypothetical protein [Longimicrobiaceae bacterium]